MNTWIAKLARQCAALVVLSVAMTAWAQNTLLNGHYAALVSGYDGANHAQSLLISFVADGNGNITSAVLDAAKDDNTAALTNAAFTGTYAVFANNRGTITLSSTTGAVRRFVIGAGAVVNGVATQGSILQTGPALTGFFERQDTAAFSTAALTGNYAFGSSGKTLVSGGEMEMASVGSIALNNGSLTGVFDYGDFTGLQLTDTALTGNLSVAANGRGTATFSVGSASSHYVIEVISAAKFLMLSTDTGSVWTGTALKQSGAPFTVAALQGNSVFAETEPTDSGLKVQIGILKCDGAGNCTVTFDENTHGTVESGPLSGRASITSATTGKFLLDFGGGNTGSGYIVAPNTVIVEDDLANGKIIFGEAQTGGPFSNASLAGSAVQGTVPIAQPVFGAGPAFVSAVATLDGVGNTSVIADLVTMNYGPTGTTAEAQTGIPLSLPYSVDPDGRVTFGGGQAVGYIVSPTKVITAGMVPGDPNPVVRVGIATNVPPLATVAPQSGWWWDPKLSGAGFFIEYGGSSANGIFVAAFLGDPAGNATWLVSTGPLSGSRYNGTWLNVTGGQTLTGPYHAPTGNANAGNVSINFTDATHAVLTRPDGSTINIQRFSFTSNPIPPPEDGTSEVGWWWGGSALSGSGYAMEFQGNNVFIVAYSYDSGGNPTWYLATGTLTAPKQYTGSWDLYGGSPQLGSAEGTFNVHKVSTATPMTLTFNDRTHATMKMGTVTVQISRFQAF